MSRTIKLAACTVLMVSLASAGFAQTAAPAGVPANAQAGMEMAVPTSADFLIKGATGNKFEIDSSKLAQTKSRSEPVQAFAKMMIADHGEAATKMKEAVTDAKLSAPPDALDAKHQAILDDLAKKNGPTFDKAYVEAQLKAHEETIALFQAYADGGDNARIKQFARDLLPTLRKHLEHVQKLKA